MALFKFRTGYDHDTVEMKSKAIVEHSLRCSTITRIEGQVSLDSSMPKIIDDPLPVIIIINGSGGCGKGTFIDLVRRFSQKKVLEISTVDPVRSTAETLIRSRNDMFSDLFEEPQTSAALHAENRTDQYRKLLHDLKMVWETFDDGPNVYCLGSIIRAIEDPEIGMIFVNIREPSNITRFRDMVFDIGLVCVTMIVNGITDPEEYKKIYGVDVNSYRYDFTITNKGSVEDLSIPAFTFATYVNRSNQIYGVSRAKAYDFMKSLENQNIEASGTKEGVAFEPEPFPCDIDTDGSNRLDEPEYKNNGDYTTDTTSRIGGQDYSVEDTI